MFKSTIVFALAFLSVADGKRILRGEKKEITQEKKRQFTLFAKEEEEPTAFHLKPGQEISPRGVRRLLAEDKQQRHRRELRGGNGGNGGSGSGSGSGSSGSDSSDEPEWILNIDDVVSLVALTGMSGEIINFVPAGGAVPEGICTSTTCNGIVSATAEGYDCDPDGDDFEDTCLDVIVTDPNGSIGFTCPEPTDVMRIQTATCVCVGPNPVGACTPDMMIGFPGPSYVVPPPMANTCGGGGGPFAITATLVCESVVAGSSSSTSTSGSSTGSSGSSTGKSSSTTDRRQ